MQSRIFINSLLDSVHVQRLVHFRVAVVERLNVIHFNLFRVSSFLVELLKAVDPRLAGLDPISIRSLFQSAHPHVTPPTQHYKEHS